MTTRKIIRTRQPQTVVPINRENPLFAGLVGSYTPIDPGAVLGGRASVVGNITQVPGVAGIGWKGAYQSSNNYVKIDRTAEFGYTSQVTFEALLSVASFQTTTFPYISGIISQYTSPAEFGPALRFNPDATLVNAAVPTFIVTQSGGTERRATGASLVANRVYHILGTYDGANVSLYVDGALVGQTAVTGVFENLSSNFISLLSDYVGTGAPGHNRCLNGSLFLARIYNRGKTAAEAKALSENVWQLFAPRREPIWVGITDAAILGTTPVLSGATWINPTQTTARPRVSITI